MASYIENFSSTNNILNPFKRLGAFPIDITGMFNSVADAQKYAKYVTYASDYVVPDTDKDSRELGGTAYIGQLISVYENDKVSVFKIQPDGSLGSIGGTDTKSASSYLQAVSISNECAVGQLIKISSDAGKTEDGNGNFFADGFYIVTSPGSILSLSTSSGNLSQDEVKALQAALNTLTDKFNNFKSDIYKTEEVDGEQVTTLDVYRKSEVDSIKINLETEINKKAAVSTVDALSSTVSNALNSISDLQNNKADNSTVTGLQTAVSGIQTQLESVVTNSSLSTTLESYYTKTDVDKDFAKKSDIKNYKIVKSEASGEFAAVYKLQVNGADSEDSVSINIPRDLVVSSGEVKYVETVDAPYAGAVVGEPYIELQLANGGSPIYIPAKTLVDIYTSGDNYINVSEDNKITLNESTLEALISSKLAGYATEDFVTGKVSAGVSEAKAYADTKKNEAIDTASDAVDVKLTSYVTSTSFETYKTSHDVVVAGINEKITSLEGTASTTTSAIAVLQSQLSGESGSGLKDLVTANSGKIETLTTALGDSSNGIVKDVATLTTDVTNLKNTAVQTVSLSSGAAVTKEGTSISIPVVTNLTNLTEENKKAPVSAGAVSTVVNSLQSSIDNKEIVKFVEDLPSTEDAKVNVIYVTNVEGKKTEFVKLSSDATSLYELGSERFARKDVMASFEMDENFEYISGNNGLMSGQDKYKLDNITALTTSEVLSVLV
jgi:hypothetical protein